MNSQELKGSVKLEILVALVFKSVEMVFFKIEKVMFSVSMVANTETSGNGC